MAIGINIITDGPCMELTKDMFELIFPQGLFEWFELTDGRSDEQQVYFTLTEKDLPPLLHPHQTIVARKCHDDRLSPARETHTPDRPTTLLEAGRPGRVSET